jgi:predicted nuclease with TOPRIM domain
MAYSTSELTSKYESLWDQQDELFREMSEINKRLTTVESSNIQLVHMEKSMSDLHTKMYALNTKMSNIFYIVESFKTKRLTNESLFQYYFNIFTVVALLSMYYL